VMRYGLIDWYAGFPVRSLYVKLLEDALATPLQFTSNLDEADIALVGAWGAGHRRTLFCSLAKPWKLYITGEPTNADFQFVHHSLSFDPLDYWGRNFRFEHWLCDLHWYDDVPTTFTKAETDELLDTNRPLAAYARSVPTRKRKAVAVFNNPEKRRIAVFEALRRRGLIDGIGKPFGDEGTHAYRAKCERIAEYVINQCLENCFYHGYYTEKVMHARAVACIPLTWSDADVAMDFHAEGIINLRQFGSLDALADHVELLLRDESRIADLVNRPILKRTPSLEGAKRFLAGAYDQFRRREIPDAGEGFIHGRTAVAEPPAIRRRAVNFLGRTLRKIGEKLIDYSSR
jgi:hypothetical protein